MSSHSEQESVIDVLASALKSPRKSGVCAVQKWVLTQEEVEPGIQEIMGKICEARNDLNLTRLYRDLRSRFNVPFSVTVFKYHTAGECVCRKN